MPLNGLCRHNLTSASLKHRRICDRGANRRAAALTSKFSQSKFAFRCMEPLRRGNRSMLESMRAFGRECH